MRLIVKNFSSNKSPYNEFEWVDESKGSEERLVFKYYVPTDRMKNNRYMHALDELLFDTRSINSKWEFVINGSNLEIYDGKTLIASLKKSQSNHYIKQINDPRNNIEVVIDNIINWISEVKSIFDKLGIKFKR